MRCSLAVSPGSWPCHPLLPPIIPERSGGQPDDIALGVTHADEPVSLIRAFLLGVEPDALITKTAHHVVEVVDGENRRPPGAGAIADPVGMVSCERQDRLACRHRQRAELAGFQPPDSEAEYAGVPGDHAGEDPA